jgi:hypothetical protein
MKKHIIIIGLILLLLILNFSGCIDDKELDNAEALSIEYFIVEPGYVNIGQSAFLNWKVVGATSVTIDNNIGYVGLSGKQLIYPEKDTMYKLRAFDSNTYVEANVIVYVNDESSDLPITPFLGMTKDKTGTSVILTIGQITEENILWSKSDYVLIDKTSGTEITNGITYPSSGTISGGDIIQIKELEISNEYRFTITYKPTGGTMGSISWTQ